ncbi:MAG: hypothetical protein ABUJ92_00075 [Desulfobacterales bacterium]
MSEIISTSKLDVSITLKLNEAEARMLVEMTGYGADPFLRGYYKVLGKSYMRPHEEALKSFFSSINSQLPSHIRRVDKARKVFEGVDSE